ncbi:MAG: class I SAM-dependent methyltransferase [Sedimentisphaerales bacterium]|nr:class I SAM-dependent methyltransferase [Sedimentisphaerales bacterium]
MRTRISPENPYGYDRRGFAWECIEAQSSAHLDFGCNDGRFLNSLKNKHIGRLAGVDVSAEAIDRGRELYPDLEIMHIRQATALPFDDGVFDSITIMDVLEHVTPQSELLVELNRVLKDDGKLVVTVPGRHVFSFLDMGNFKFRFPRLHKWYYRLGHSPQQYERRYVSNPDGLVGDISAEKCWHEHFSRLKLSDLLERGGFSVVFFDGDGFFRRLITPAEYFLHRLKPLMKVLRRLRDIDARSFESANLFCVAQKRRGQ